MSSILLFLFGSTLFHSAIATVSNIGLSGSVEDAYETGDRSYWNKIGQVEYFLAYVFGEDSAGKISHRGIGTSSETELHFRDTLFQRRRRNPATILNWVLASRRPQTARYIVRGRLPGNNRPAAFIATMGKREYSGDFVPVKPRVN